jgi:hypothetical protein
MGYVTVEKRQLRDREHAASSRQRKLVEDRVSQSSASEHLEEIQACSRKSRGEIRPCFVLLFILSFSSIFFSSLPLSLLSRYPLPLSSSFLLSLSLQTLARRWRCDRQQRERRHRASKQQSPTGECDVSQTPHARSRRRTIRNSLCCIYPLSLLCFLLLMAFASVFFSFFPIFSFPLSLFLLLPFSPSRPIALCRTSRMSFTRATNRSSEFATVISVPFPAAVLDASSVLPMKRHTNLRSTVKVTWSGRIFAAFIAS